MKILLVGKTGVLDTFAVASGYLNQIDIGNCPHFADIKLENSKKLVKIGVANNNELFVVGYNTPEIIFKFNKELGSLSNINEKERMHVIPISITGENTTWLLSKLANLPLIGPIFLNWAKKRTLNRSPYLLELGKTLLLEEFIEKDNSELVFAAKPYRKAEKK